MGIGLEYYCEHVKEIEVERNILVEFCYSKNVFHYLKRKKHKKRIEKLDEILMHCYEFIGKQI